MSGSVSSPPSSWGYSDKPTEKDFETLLIAELPVLLRVARRLTANDPSTEDLVAQTVLQALTSRSKFDGRFLRSWLIRILHRMHVRELSKRPAKPPARIDEVDPVDEQGWKTADQNLVKQQIYDQLDRLPGEYRMAIVLCDVEELSYEEAAKALELPIGTIRSRLFRGRKLLRERLENLLNNDDLPGEK